MRKLILENIQEALTDKVVAKEYIFVNRGAQAEIEELPVVNINSVSENTSVFNESPRTYRRLLILNVECITTGSNFKESDAILESMVKTTEQIIESNEYLNGLERTTILNDIDYDFSSEGQSPIAAAVLTYNCEFIESAQDFDKVAYDALISVNSDWKIKDNTTEDEIDATDIVDNLNK